MADLISQFNDGVLTSTDLTEQFNDKFWSKGAIREAMRKRTFTQLGDRLTQPKHYGDAIEKERHYPILHPMNRIDNGINANAATLLKQVWFAYDENGAMTGNAEGYSVVEYTSEALAIVAAQAAADAAQAGVGTIKSGAGSLFNGDADFTILSGAYPSLTEVGGNVNAVNAKSVVVKGNVAEFGMHMKFTQRAIDMDSRVGVLAQKTKDLGEAKGDIYEAQVQSDLLASSVTNRVFAGDATSLATVGAGDELTFADLRLMEQELKKGLVPKDTKVITGSTKVGTKVVGKAYYAYVGQELYPTLQDMVHGSINVWEPVESYMDAAGNNIAEGEIGRIGGFRFIEVDNMQAYRGAGAANNDATDDTDGANRHATGVNYDVFPTLFVGSDSFATVGFEGDSSRIKTAMPKPDANNDPFGKNGSMSIAWYFGTLIYRPERIRQIVSCAKIS